MYGFEIVSSYLCSFCLKESETLLYLFCDRKTVKALWNDLFECVLTSLHLNFPLIDPFKLFGFHEKNN